MVKGHTKNFQAVSLALSHPQQKAKQLSLNKDPQVDKTSQKGQGGKAQLQRGCSIKSTPAWMVTSHSRTDGDHQSFHIINSP